MKFVSLRIAGFKSFMEPVDIPVLDGLTGIVGPNGCGKSNLVEAIRWVMGENSYKNMRASGMDDVIFAGTTTRPARNGAEVAITIDNRDHTAPAAFNGEETLVVSRRITRGTGSTYRINGSEVRARDVQLLFADAASGARSPALVRQGQIAELINARPQARRRILEDAAGIAGLYARRHEAEMRLKAADANLLRVEDILRTMAGQVEGLRRQSKQAVRYRTLSAAILRAEGLMLYRRFIEAHEQHEQAQAEARAAATQVADALSRHNAAITEQAVSAHELPALREAEARAAAALHLLATARDALDAEEKRAALRGGELDRQLRDIDADLAREATQGQDAAQAMARLEGERVALEEAAALAVAAEQTAKAELAIATTRVGASETALDDAMGVLASITARRQQLERTLRDVSERLMRLTGQIDDVEREAERLEAGKDNADLAPLREAVEAARLALADAEAAALACEGASARARTGEYEARAAMNDADKAAQRLETEAGTLTRLLFSGSEAGAHSVLQQIGVDAGVERALGAALGDDLSASLDPDAATVWQDAGAGEDDAPLPAGVQPLSAYVRAPAVMARRLAQIGLVEAADGPRLMGQLRAGQRLVSVEGALWRWDGLVQAASAPSASARRLEEKNRLARIEADFAAARSLADAVRLAFDHKRRAVEVAMAAESAARENWRTAQRGLGAAQEQLVQAERAQAGLVARLAALKEARSHLDASLREADAVKKESLAALEAFEDRDADEARILALRQDVAQARAAMGEATARCQSFNSEARQREKRLDSIVFEHASWQQRIGQAGRQAETLRQRREEASRERDRLDGLPGRLREQRLQLLGEIDTAQAKRSEAAAAFARGETRVATADRAVRDAALLLAEAREGEMRALVRLEALTARCAELKTALQELLQAPWTDLTLRLELREGQMPPSINEIEAELTELRRERERLGAVNLLAESELAEIEARNNTLLAERDDLVAAIRRLRAGISSLNTRGRERLLEAFKVVNGHFQRLFTTLFGGGVAELVLSESDDPLEAGLEIIARPPGKKPQAMSLLSGGEQALTAMALIFSVFLANPAPVCVLDEVDAPLDDHNVERFCALLQAMIHDASTRFLVITHNPITMARMNRLYGVTMAERGVSQLVSVDLEAAGRILDAA